jgi:hypothetical protein
LAASRMALASRSRIRHIHEALCSVIIIRFSEWRPRRCACLCASDSRAKTCAPCSMLHGVGKPVQ